MAIITQGWIRPTEEAVLIKNDCLEECLEEKVVDMFAENGLEIVERKTITISLERALSLYLDEVIGAENDEMYRYRVAGVFNIIGEGEILVIRDCNRLSKKSLSEKVHSLKGTSNEANIETVRGRFRGIIPEGLEGNELLMMIVRNRMHFYRNRQEKLALELFLSNDYSYEGSSYSLYEVPKWYYLPQGENEYLSSAAIEFKKSTLYPTLRTGEELYEATTLEEAKQLILKYWRLMDKIGIN